MFTNFDHLGHSNIKIYKCVLISKWTGFFFYMQENSLRIYWKIDVKDRGKRMLIITIIACKRNIWYDFNDMYM